jgi:hypothetical protein
VNLATAICLLSKYFSPSADSFDQSRLVMAMVVTSHDHIFSFDRPVTITETQTWSRTGWSRLVTRRRPLVKNYLLFKYLCWSGRNPLYHADIYFIEQLFSYRAKVIEQIIFLYWAFKFQRLKNKKYEIWIISLLILPFTFLAIHVMCITRNHRKEKYTTLNWIPRSKSLSKTFSILRFSIFKFLQLKTFQNDYLKAWTFNCTLEPRFPFTLLTSF